MVKALAAALQRKARAGAVSGAPLRAVMEKSLGAVCGERALYGV